MEGGGEVSDTPITDSVKVRSRRGLWVVNADYMQQIERENTALRAHAERLAEALEKVQGYGRCDMGHQQMCDYVTEVADQALTLYRAENPKV